MNPPALTQNDMTKCCTNYVAGMCEQFASDTSVQGKIQYSNCTRLYTPLCGTADVKNHCQSQKNQGKLQ